MTRRSSNRLVGSLFLTLVLCVGFGVWQNGHGVVGGSISPAKIVWLTLALGCFLVVPACLWLDRRRSQPGHRLWGGFLLGFAIRALIELPILVFTRSWRCEYGIAHDALMLLWLGYGFFRVPDTDRVTRAFAIVVSLALIAEILNAFLFSRAANPAEGVYFAPDAPAFSTINRITWLEIGVLTPMLAFCVRMHRKEVAG
jgi:hypothetical protein